jgi:hypothetical protein
LGVELGVGEIPSHGRHALRGFRRGFVPDLTASSARLRPVPVSLPERTVDAWVSIYVASRVPDVRIWAPTQQQTPDYDIAGSLPGPGKLFVLEDKAPRTNDASGSHAFQLPIRQMWNYLRNPSLRDRTFYVLACPHFR